MPKWEVIYARSLSPKPEPWLSWDLANALRESGRYEEAVSEYKKALQLAPDSFGIHVDLTVTYSMMGKDKEARAKAEEVLRLNPKFSCDLWAKTETFKDQSVTDRHVDASSNRDQEHSPEVYQALWLGWQGRLWDA